jgi:hypothetical protein
MAASASQLSSRPAAARQMAAANSVSPSGWLPVALTRLDPAVG